MENRMDTMLSTNADAQLVLKLYELRTEPRMRTARTWVASQFRPQTAQDCINILHDYGSLECGYLLQVESYWEMAAAFVLHGALDADLFLSCNSENLFVLAKLHPFLREIRSEIPQFFARTEELTTRFKAARLRLEEMIKVQEGRRAQGSQQPVAY